MFLTSQLYIEQYKKDNHKKIHYKQQITLLLMIKTSKNNSLSTKALTGQTALMIHEKLHFVQEHTTKQYLHTWHYFHLLTYNYWCYF